MIKKVVAAACAALTLFLCGCGGYRETDGCYIVSAVGFDGGEKIRISVEIVSSGGGADTSEINSDIISGEGDTPEGAMFSLSSRTSKILSFDHCTAILIGESITGERFDDIIGFGKELKELNLSVGLFCCRSAAELLRGSSADSVARGFDITGNIRETKKDTGIDYGNRLFEVFAAYKNKKLFALPFLEVREERIVIDGERVYSRNTEVDALSNADSLIYSFIINRNSGGKIYFGKEYADVSLCRFKYSDGEYKGNVHIKNESDGFAKVFEKKCNEFLGDHAEKLRLKSGKADIQIKGGG